MLTNVTDTSQLSMDGLVAGSVIVCANLPYVGGHNINLLTQNSPDLTPYLGLLLIEFGYVE